MSKLQIRGETTKGENLTLDFNLNDEGTFTVTDPDRHKHFELFSTYDFGSPRKSYDIAILVENVRAGFEFVEYFYGAGFIEIPEQFGENCKFIYECIKNYYERKKIK